VRVKVTCRTCFAAASIVAAFCSIGCRAGQPGKARTVTINWIKHHLTVGGKHDQNPMRPTTANIETGKQTFGGYCAVCHGLDGQNTGVPFATTIDPPIPLLSSRSVQAYSDGQLRRVIEAGIAPSGMPAAKGILSDEEIWQIVIYIRHLPPAGSLGEPKAYAGDPLSPPATAPINPFVK
jgi:mono/diheme cytochrome c family protein